MGKKNADAMRPPLGNKDMNSGSPQPTNLRGVFDNRKRSDNYGEKSHRDNLPKQHNYHNKHRVLKQSNSLDVSSHFGNNQYTSTNESTTKESSEQSPALAPS